MIVDVGNVMGVYRALLVLHVQNVKFSHLFFRFMDLTSFLVLEAFNIFIRLSRQAAKGPLNLVSVLEHDKYIRSRKRHYLSLVFTYLAYFWLMHTLILRDCFI